MSEPIYKLLDLNDTHRDWIQSLVMNGYTFEEIANALGLSKTGFQRSLANKTEIQHILKQGSEKAISNATMSLSKLADGFVRTEREYVVSIDKEKVKEHRKRLIALLEDQKIEDFLTVFMGLTLEGSKNVNGVVKVKEIEVPPDKNAAIKILEALKEDVWDLDAKHKKIPDVKITVGIEGEDAKRLLKQKQIKPDYVVEVR